jgi:hypothetical protein
MAQKDAGMDYDPTKHNYHPIDDACWSKGDKYVGFTDTNTLDVLTLSCIQGMHKIMVLFQKLIKNVFLNLHGLNVHCQQRELSKFLLRYQQFTSHAYYRATGPVSKMVSQQEKAFYVLHFEVSRLITAHLEFRGRFKKDAPHRNNITRHSSK